VVIPALDEADRIAGAVRPAGGSGPRCDVALEASVPGRDGERDAQPEPTVLVVDGGSADDTAERARRAGARVLHSEPGRARQIDAGWRATSSEVVVFLHADTRLEDDWPTTLRTALADPAVAGGAFRLRFDDPGWAFRVLEAFVALRVRWLGLPYGDQAIFVRRRILEDIGGIPPVPLMEDLDLVARMKAHGRVVALSAAATTSSRRYRERGVCRTVVAHGAALLAWRLGLDRARVLRWVRG